MPLILLFTPIIYLFIITFGDDGLFSKFYWDCTFKVLLAIIIVPLILGIGAIGGVILLAILIIPAEIY